MINNKIEWHISPWRRMYFSVGYTTAPAKQQSQRKKPATGCPVSTARLAGPAPRAAGARRKRRQTTGFWTDLQIDQHRAQVVGRFQDFQENLKNYRLVKYDTETTSNR